MRTRRALLLLCAAVAASLRSVGCEEAAGAALPLPAWHPRRFSHRRASRRTAPPAAPARRAALTRAATHARLRAGRRGRRCRLWTPRQSPPPPRMRSLRPPPPCPPRQLHPA
jgi:hypothetical protein